MPMIILTAIEYGYHTGVYLQRFLLEMHSVIAKSDK